MGVRPLIVHPNLKRGVIPKSWRRPSWRSVLGSILLISGAVAAVFALFW